MRGQRQGISCLKECIDETHDTKDAAHETCTSPKWSMTAVVLGEATSSSFTASKSAVMPGANACGKVMRQRHAARAHGKRTRQNHAAVHDPQARLTPLIMREPRKKKGGAEGADG